MKKDGEWNFAAKFYFVCIIIFVLLVAYIQIYRYIHRDQIIENIKNNEKEIVVDDTTEQNKVK